MKTYFKFLKLTIFFFVLCNVEGQVNGTKTIGGTSPDFPDITSAISFLRANGINGNVILNIRDGVYTGKFEVTDIPGTDMYSITFQSESQDTARVKIVYTANAQNDHMIKLTKIKNISFNHISFFFTGYDYTCHMFHMYNNATKVKLENNNFQSKTDSYIIYAPGATGGEASVDTIQICNNKFVSGSCGVFLEGGYYDIVDSVVINNNVFLNQKEKGIDLRSCEGVTIISNTITSTVGQNASVDIFGIGLTYGKNFEISSNKINVNFGIGILLDGCINTVALKRLVSNNFITVKPALDSWTGSSMYIDGSVYVDIIHNTLRRIGNGGITNGGLKISGSAYINLLNNIIYNNEAYSLSLDSNSGLISNYNYLFSANQYFARFNTTVCITFDEWKTISSLDANSVSGNIAFISDADSHIKITDASNILIDNKGTQWNTVTKDIDNETRNNPPDIGADEFIFPNKPPVINNQTFSVAENSANGTIVGVVVASDPDAGQTLTYSITAGNELSAFSIDGATGAITVIKSSALDFDTTPSFVLTITVQDNGDNVLSGSATITINLTKAIGVNSISGDKANYIYPNPSYGIININPELFKEGKICIEIFDLNGKLILRKENISESDPVEISQAGIFNVNLIVNNKVYNQRIINIR